MPPPRVTVAIATLAADESLRECLHSIESQTLDGYEVVVVDNSGAKRVEPHDPRVKVISNDRNVGFGAAINQVIRESTGEYVATINDDAVAEPGWLEALVCAAASRADVGMCASLVRLSGGGLDSAGMLIAGDGSGKQRGHGVPADGYARRANVLLPSGSAALYKRAMLEDIGGFDETFFLYCEDIDLGLRGRWRGWECVFVPEARVEHRYSRSAGRASPLKAWYVERNRVFVVLKNFPASMILLVPFFVLARYFWHVVSLFGGQGKAAEFRAAGHSPWALARYVVLAHLEALRHFRRLWTERKRIRRTAYLTPRQFRRLLGAHSISVRQVASL